MSKKYEDYVLYSDYDGTLTDSLGNVSKENIDGIEYFINNGGIFSLATGRGIGDIIKFELPINGVIVSSNGSVIIDNKTMTPLLTYYVGNDVLKLAKEIYNTHPELGLSVITDECTKFIRLIDSVYKVNPKVSLNYIQINDLTLIKDKIVSLCIHGQESDIQEIKKYISVKYSHYKCVDAFPKFLSVVNKLSGKGMAIEHVKNNYYLNKTILAVGDGDNDIEMMSKSDISFAMGNGSIKLKEEADFVLKENDNPCIPQILKIIDERSKND